MKLPGKRRRPYAVKAFAVSQRGTIVLLARHLGKEIPETVRDNYLNVATKGRLLSIILIYGLSNYPMVLATSPAGGSRNTS